MAVFLLANKNSDKTTVTIEEIRKFVEDISDIDNSIKAARGELKNALDEDEKIDELKDQIKLAQQGLKTYVESHTVYKEYSARLDILKEDKRDIVSEAKTSGIPKKEIDLAIKALKSDIDIQESTEIYANISDMIE